ncbi:MAG: YfhO family protein [Candidatus Omnitrophota bacterium]
MSIAVTLSFLGGHPEHILLVNSYCFCFFMYRIFVLRHSISPTQAVQKLLLAYLLAAGLSAFITFPFLKNLLFEFWHGHPQKVGLLLEEQRSRALTLVMPYFFQAVPLTYQWFFSGWWGGYIGLLPFALTFISFFNNQKKYANGFFTLMAFLIISKQYALPYINWIGHLPGFNVCRFAPHTPPLAAFSMAVCAGMGVRSILNSRNLFLKGLPFSLLLIGIAAAHLIFLQNPDGQRQALHASLLALSLIVIFQGILFCRDKKILTRTVTGLLLLAVVFGELFSYIHRERPFRFHSFGEVPYIKFIKDQPERVRSYGNFWAFYPNTASGFEVDDLGIFFGLVPKRFVHLVNTLFVPNHFRDDLRPPALRAIPLPYSENILDLLNVRYIIKPTDSTFEKKFPHFKNVTKDYTPVYQNKVEIYERPSAYPRAFIVHKAIFQTDDEQALRILKQLKDKNRYVAVINHPPIIPIQQLLKSAPIEDNSAVKISHYSANQVALGVHMQSPGFLILSDAYHPDWKVYINGKPSKIFRTDYFIRSVFLPAGHHKVHYVFSPDSFKIGSIVSLASLLLLLFLSTRQGGGRVLPPPRQPEQNPGPS